MDSTHCFFLSSTISLYVAQLKRRNAAIMRRPPAIAPGERLLPMNAQSARATMKIVRLAGVSITMGRR